MLHIYNRQCNFSTISANKYRPKWFNRETCFKSLLCEYNANHDQTTLTILFDGQPNKEHFCSKMNDIGSIPIINLNSGNGAKSFIDSVDYILKQNHKNEDIIYLVEDDYLHIPMWGSTLLSAFTLNLPNLHVTLYDHLDKYTEMYANLLSKIFVSKRSHWRTVPSTTDTFAVRFDTLKKYRDIYWGFWRDGYSLDHMRSLEVGRNGGVFISPIHGWSTHVGEYNSPLINWEGINNNYEN